MTATDWLNKIPPEFHKYARQYAIMKCEEQRGLCADRVWGNGFKFMDKLNRHEGAQLIKYVENAPEPNFDM